METSPEHSPRRFCGGYCGEVGVLREFRHCKSSAATVANWYVRHASRKLKKRQRLQMLPEAAAVFSRTSPAWLPSSHASGAFQLSSQAASGEVTTKGQRCSAMPEVSSGGSWLLRAARGAF